MGVAYLKFEDGETPGDVTVSGGIEGILNPGSAAHLTVLRLSKHTEAMGQFLAALPPFQLTDLPEGVEVAKPDAVAEESAA